MNYTYDYPKADHTVDAVVFGLDIKDDILKVLLVRRGGEPFVGSWALPGGFIKMEEGLEDALRRELEEETGLKISYLEQLYTFGLPDRDPRGRVISTAYLALVRPQEVKAGSDAAEAAWTPVEIALVYPLAFDHNKILGVALQRLRSKAPWQPIGIELLPKEFTLTCLQQVYEVILGHPLDKRNFRRKVLSFGVLIPTDKFIKENHRPARLYRFNTVKYKALLSHGIDFEI